MLRKTANFIINKRIAILVIMLVLAAAGGICSFYVNTNEDMTKYLPDDSRMKTGLDIMNEAFPEEEISNTLRVMIDDLSDAEKEAVPGLLRAIPNVERVDYDSDNPDYSKDNHTLYVITMSCDYRSKEEKAIVAALKERFADKPVAWHNDDTSNPEIPVTVLVVVAIILFVILFLMCGSWFEPFLFLATIGIAVVLNLGTNLILGSVSSVTKSIAAILQLALSMDYSIILMNRYRQERQLAPDKLTAMKNAWANAFSSVASSSLTTVVGLLMLIFMSFKIGADLGIVLAKGVFLSMLCVLTVLPALILLFDKLLIRTAKKELHIPMNWAGSFSYKLRYLLTGLFLVLFGVFCFLQTKTGIAYSLVKDDAVADVFPKTNTMVMVYENKDEERLKGLADRIEPDENVTSVMSYGTTLSKAFTSSEMADTISEMSDDFSFEPAMMDVLYYHYFNGGRTGKMTAGEFLSFLSDTVMNGKSFSAYIDADMRRNTDLIRRFSDAKTLQQPMTAEELADLFEMDPSNIKDLFLLYQIKSGAAASESMTLASFADFVIHDVANDPAYGSLFDAETRKELSRLADFTNAEKMTTPYSYKEIASLLNLDADKTRLLFVYYYALSDQYTPGKMTLPEFVSFLKNDIAADPAFSSYLDPNALSQINALSPYTNKATLKKQMSAAELASFLGIDESMVQTIFIFHNAQGVPDKTMSLAQFSSFLNGAMQTNPMFADSLDEATRARLQTLDSLIRQAASGQALTVGQMASVLGMEEENLKQLYYLYFSPDAGFQQEVSAVTMPLPEFFALLKENSPPEQRPMLETMEPLIAVLATGDPLTPAALSGLFGIEQTQVLQLLGFQMASRKAVSLADFTAFLVNDVLQNEAYAAGFTEEQKTQLITLNRLVQFAASGTGLDAAALAKTFGMEEAQVVALFRLYYGSDISGKTMSLKKTIDFILSDPVMQDYPDSANLAQLEMLQNLIQATLNNTSFTYSELGQFLGMESSLLKMLFVVRDSGTQLKKWSLSVQTIVNFLVAHKDRLGEMMDPGQISSLETAKAIINGAVSRTSYTADEIASLTGMTQDQTRQLYLLYTRKHGDTSGWKLSVKGFLGFLIQNVFPNPDYAELIDAATQNRIFSANIMVDAVISNKPYTAEEMGNLFRGLTDEGNAESVGLLYLYAESLEKPDPSRKMTLEELFNHLVDHILNDPRFEPFLDEETKAELLSSRQTLEDGKAQLISDRYSRMVITTTYPGESEETTAFIADLEKYTKDHAEGDVYFIGDSVMNYEMQQIFDKELLFITLLTAFAIFLIVALTFRSLVVPIILVLLVQCSVYITVTVTGIMSGGMYYLALLIVECILMGSTIDYGILFTNYYRESRKKEKVKEALKKAYAGSIHTIMTSGLILVLVTAAVGRLFEDEAVSAIVRTISIGALCAIILILFILPGLLAACDKLVTRKKDRLPDSGHTHLKSRFFHFPESSSADPPQT